MEGTAEPLRYGSNRWRQRWGAPGMAKAKAALQHRGVGRGRAAFMPERQCGRIGRRARGQRREKAMSGHPLAGRGFPQGLAGGHTINPDPARCGQQADGPGLRSFSRGGGKRQIFGVQQAKGKKGGNKQGPKTPGRTPLYPLRHAAASFHGHSPLILLFHKEKKL